MDDDDDDGVRDDDEIVEYIGRNRLKRNRGEGILNIWKCIYDCF